METLIGNGRFFTGECFAVMQDLPDKSVDLVLCDLPYGTTGNKWDSILPLELLWKEYERLLKPSGCAVLTASMPFTAKIVASNYEAFRYAWIWEKSKASNFLDAKHRPLKAHEDILVFSFHSKPVYNPQMIAGDPYSGAGRRKSPKVWGGVMDVADITKQNDNAGTRYPRSVQYFKTAESEGKGVSWHPTQKPVALFEYLIRTHSNEGDVVLDNTAGSGTTAIAAENTGRKWICIEKDSEYASKAIERIRNATASIENVSNNPLFQFGDEKGV